MKLSNVICEILLICFVSERIVNERFCITATVYVTDIVFSTISVCTLHKYILV